MESFITFEVVILRNTYIAMAVCLTILFRLVSFNIIAFSPAHNKSGNTQLAIGSVYKEVQKKRCFVSPLTEEDASGDQIVAEKAEEDGDDFIKKIKLLLGFSGFVFFLRKLFLFIEERAPFISSWVTPNFQAKKYLSISVLRI